MIRFAMAPYYFFGLIAGFKAYWIEMTKSANFPARGEWHVPY